MFIITKKQWENIKEIFNYCLAGVLVSILVGAEFWIG